MYEYLYIALLGLEHRVTYGVRVGHGWGKSTVISLHRQTTNVSLRPNYSSTFSRDTSQHHKRVHCTGALLVRIIHPSVILWTMHGTVVSIMVNLLPLSHCQYCDKYASDCRRLLLRPSCGAARSTWHLHAAPAHEFAVIHPLGAHLRAGLIPLNGLFE